MGGDALLKWPAEPCHVIDYLIDLHNTGAPRTVPQAFAAALSFMERASGVGSGERLADGGAEPGGEGEGVRADGEEAGGAPAGEELLVMDRGEVDSWRGPARGTGSCR